MTNHKMPVILIGLLLVAGISTTLSLAQAHKGATGIVMERMMSMKSMGDGMKLIAAMIKGQAPYDAAKTTSIAAEVEKHAAGMLKQFPKGSIKGPSEALPALWTDWEGFKSYADDLTRLSEQLSQTAGGGKAAAREVFAKMANTCSGCHRAYRKK